MQLAQIPYRAEFIECVEELDDEVDSSVVDTRVDNIQELCSFSNNVE